MSEEEERRRRGEEDERRRGRGEEGGEGGEGERGRQEVKVRTPHKDVGNKTYFFSSLPMIKFCRFDVFNYIITSCSMYFFNIVFLSCI